MAGRHNASSSASKRQVGPHPNTFQTPAHASLPKTRQAPPLAATAANVSVREVLPVSWLEEEPAKVHEEFSTPEPILAPSFFTSNTAKPVSRDRLVHDSSDQLAKGLNKELTCAICLGLFKTPKMLPCLHTFCEECLKQIATQSAERMHQGHHFLAVKVVEPKGIKSYIEPACK